MSTHQISWRWLSCWGISLNSTSALIPTSKGRVRRQAALNQRIQAGQQHVLVHLLKFGRRIGRRNAAAQHQLMGDQIGGGVEQRIERQKTRAQGLLANGLVTGDAQHLGHHDGLLGFAGVDAATDYAWRNGVV